MSAAAFELLKAYDEKCQEASKKLPQRKGGAAQWRGVGFKIAGYELAISIDDVAEIVDYSETTYLPATKSWFHGMANVRGTLAAITDLREMLFAEPCALGVSTRVIMLRTGSTMIGLLVDEITGIRNSIGGKHKEFMPDIPKRLEELVDGCIEHAGRLLPVLEYALLIEDRRFLAIAETASG